MPRSSSLGVVTTPTPSTKLTAQCSCSLTLCEALQTEEDGFTLRSVTVNFVDHRRIRSLLFGLIQSNSLASVLSGDPDHR